MDKSKYENATEYVRATCLGKLEALKIPESNDAIQVACDTVIVRPDGLILEKPADLDEAYEMIEGLLGKRVKVISVVHLRSKTGGTAAFHEESELVMRGSDEITEKDIYGYLEDVNYK